MAEFYSTAEKTKTGMVFGEGIPSHVDLLRRKQLMPLAELFAVKHGSPAYNEGDQRSIFYAESWALIHLWSRGSVSGRDLKGGFTRFVGLVSEGLSSEEALKQAFGMTLEEMEYSLKSYMQHGGFKYLAAPAPEVDYAAALKFRPATDFERDTALQNLKWRMQKNDDAAYQFLQLSEREPSSPRPLEILGTIAWYGKDPEQAKSYWRSAIKAGADNPFIYMRLAQDTLRQCLWAVKLDYRLPDAVTADVRAWLDRAVELAPNYQEAWDWLALTEAFAAKPRKAVIDQLAGELKKFGKRPRMVAGLAVLLRRAKNESVAVNLATQLLRLESVSGGPSKNGTPAVSMEGALGSGSSWATKPEYYPDVKLIAQKIIKDAEQKKAAAAVAAETAEPPKDAVPSAVEK